MRANKRILIYWLSLLPAVSTSALDEQVLGVLSLEGVVAFFFLPKNKSHNNSSTFFFLRECFFILSSEEAQNNRHTAEKRIRKVVLL